MAYTTCSVSVSHTLFITSLNQHPVYTSYGKSCPLTDSIGYTQSQTPASMHVPMHNNMWYVCRAHQ